MNLMRTLCVHMAEMVSLSLDTHTVESIHLQLLVFVGNPANEQAEDYQEIPK